MAKKPFVTLVAAAVLLIAGTLPAAADVYTIELVIFERPGGGSDESWPEDAGEPDRGKAIGPLPARAGLRKSLGPAAYTLDRRGMTVLDHLAWQQTPRGRGSETWYWLDGPRLSGLIRVSRGRFLHLDTDLLLTDPAGTTFRIRLNRRMRSNELHYVDHPKLGILIEARPAGAATSSGVPPADTGSSNIAYTSVPADTWRASTGHMNAKTP